MFLSFPFKVKGRGRKDRNILERERERFEENAGRLSFKFLMRKSDLKSNLFIIRKTPAFSLSLSLYSALSFSLSSVQEKNTFPPFTISKASSLELNFNSFLCSPSFCIETGEEDDDERSNDESERRGREKVLSSLIQFHTGS